MTSTNTPKRSPRKPVNGTALPPPPTTPLKKVIAVQRSEESPIGQEAWLGTVEILGYEPKFSPASDPEQMELDRRYNASRAALRELSKE